MSVPNLGAMPIDLPKLLETRLLVQAQSGGGKSHLLRRIIEQVALGVQVIVIDPEGEFASVRERFDFILCGANGPDAVANPQTAAPLARAIWASGASAIVDIYDLKAHDRILFVRRFLEALINAPKAMWHPTLVVIDEIHIFAPQSGQAESQSAVIDLATRGRKRGLALVAATQRLSKLHKDVAAELQNKLIGRTGLDVDVARAGDELGMAKKEAWTALRALQPGDFFAYGPALSEAVIATKIGPVLTTHPKTGGRVLAAPPPPSKALKATLLKLEGIQRGEEQDAETIATLTTENARLRKDLTAALKASGIPEAEVRRRIGEVKRHYTTILATAFHKAEDLRAFLAVTPAVTPELLENLSKNPVEIRELDTPTRKAVMVKPTDDVRKSGDAGGRAIVSAALFDSPKGGAVHLVKTASLAGTSGPEQRILDAIAWMESIGVNEPEQPAVAFLAGYKFGGGAYNNPRGRLNVSGLLEYVPGGRIRLTDAGRSQANFPDKIVTANDLQGRVLSRLGGPEQRILAPLLQSYPDAMSNEDLAVAAGYTGGGGAFNNPRGRLRTLGLIDYPRPGMVVARDLLFPKGGK